MTPIAQSLSEFALAILALAAVLLTFERRLARVETRIDMILRFMGISEGGKADE